MSANVYRGTGNSSTNINVSPVNSCMTHETLIDTFRALCKQYGVEHSDIAKDIHYSPKFVRSVLNKRQYASRAEFILMCKALEARICRHIQSDIFRRGQTGYNSATYPQRK